MLNLLVFILYSFISDPTVAQNIRSTFTGQYALDMVGICAPYYNNAADDIIGS